MAITKQRQGSIPVGSGVIIEWECYSIDPESGEVPISEQQVSAEQVVQNRHLYAFFTETPKGYVIPGLEGAPYIYEEGY